MPTLLVLTLSALVFLAGGLMLLWRGQGPIRFTTGCLLLLLATAAAYSSYRQWHGSAAPTMALTSLGTGRFQAIAANQLDDALTAARGQTILVDFYADWCSSCQVWEREVFSRPEARRTLAPLLLVRVNATEFTPAVEALFQRYGLPGLPALLVFDPAGRERPELRFTGESTLADFVTRIRTQVLPLAPKSSP